MIEMFCFWLIKADILANPCIYLTVQGHKQIPF
jgi:hypothetical protein